MRRVFISTWCAGWMVVSGILSAAGQTGRPPNINELAVAAIEKYMAEQPGQIPALEINTAPNQAVFRETPLPLPPITVHDLRLHAFSFVAPEKSGHLVWGYRNAPGLVGFWLFPFAQGEKIELASHVFMTSTPGGKAEFDPRSRMEVVQSPTYRITRVAGRMLKPGGRYAIWYATADQEGSAKTVHQSVNVFPYQSYLPHSQLFPDIGLLPGPQE